jgi:uncharacterized protein (UPF0548 family)
MADVRLSRPKDERQALAALTTKAPNFDLQALDPGGGWHDDDHRQRLPTETPGPPLAGGSWETARELVEAYAFTDPGMVRAVFDRDAPLDGRNMLLELRFAGLRIYVGVRVAAVRDETRSVAGREARVWGWDYVTLEGHFEAGRRAFEVWKWLDTGEVEFRTYARARPALTNPVLRLGFFVFGGHRRAEFGRTACERMARLTAAGVSASAARLQGGEMDSSRLTGIYLEDHHAILIGSEELVKRMIGATKDGEVRAFLAELLPELRSDREAVERLLGQLGRAPSRVKSAAAWLGEKAGRLKFNGNPRGYSPLTRLVELEGLELALTGNRALWRSLEHAAPTDWREDARTRGARADERVGRVEQLRVVAAEVALAGRDRRL